VPEYCPLSTNKCLCHVSTGAPSITAKARKEVSGEACEEARREYKRHARRQGDQEGGGFGPSHSSLYPPLQPTA